jgi:hypothetical protein
MSDIQLVLVGDHVVLGDRNDTLGAVHPITFGGTEPPPGAVFPYIPIPAMPAAAAPQDSWAASKGSTMYVFGGSDGAEVFGYQGYNVNLETGVWTTMTPPQYYPVGGFGGYAAYVPAADCILSSGGYTSGNVFDTVVRVFNVATGQWVASTYASVPSAIVYGPRVMPHIGNFLYLVGGFASSAPGMPGMSFAVNTLHALDLTEKTWSAKATLPEVRGMHAAISDGTDLYVFGGSDNANAWWTGVVSTCYKYTVASNSWSAIASLAAPTARQEAVYDGNGGFLLYGGYHAGIGYTNELLRYDIATDTYETLAPSLHARVNGVATFISGRLYYTGGYDGTTSSAVGTTGVYNVATDTWLVNG